MQNAWKVLIVKLLVIVFVLPGCKTAEQHAAAQQPARPVTEGLRMVDNVFDAIQTRYVEPVHPHQVLVSAARGIEKEFDDSTLLKEISGEIRVLSPATHKPYSLEIPEEGVREALHALYAYGVDSRGGEPLRVSYAMAGRMVEGLDPHCSVLTPEEYEELKIDAGGKLSGIGVSVTVRDHRVQVITAQEDSPAYRAGIQSGDVITKVDGHPVFELRKAVRMMRGPAGTAVVVTITRPGRDAPFDLRLVRETLSVTPLKSVNLEPGIWYVRLTHFNKETPQRLEDLLRQASREGSSIRGMIIDLRDNPGGLLSATLRSTDYFIRDGELLFIKGRTAQSMKRFSARPDGIEGDFPVVALINGGTASAAEIMAGTLRDRGRALLIGDVTFGKGSTQEVSELPGGYAVKMTIARYELPSGRKIDRIGLQPDILMSPEADALRERDLQGAGKAQTLAKAENKGGETPAAHPAQGRLDPGHLRKDPEVDRALSILKRTRSALLKDMLAADPEIEVAAPLPARPSPTAAPPAPTAAAPSLAIQPRLFVLSIGVSRYRESRLSLAYAERDARSLAEALATQGKTLFSEVRTLVLVDEAVSRDSVVRSMNRFLGEAVSSDVVLIFVAGHGVRRTATGTFYFLPHEADHENLSTKGLRWSDFQEEVAVLGARVRNVILMLDTCHAGSLQVGMRGIAVTPDMSSAFQRKGTYVLAAASADEAAVEAETWGHGAFTQAILAGLHGGADYNGDQIVDIVELFHHVETSVADMTGGLQHPRFQMGGGSLPLYALSPSGPDQGNPLK